ITPTLQVEDLSGGQRQAVAIARSLLRAKKALLLDEPTAALGPRQSDLVCEAIKAVASKGIALLVVSHDLERMLTTATRIAVLHRGRIAMDQPASGLTIRDIVSAMMGRHAETAGA
ncbi:ATP-binding cassette domain-containing protein, partial [Mesorhizobium sp. M7A.F.Ca.US.006.01.1.1]|uniref:ATP-binding cassette domain-containing protein n=1 Tax=Mesorhizobium sp. M7A.F.Ca.US.006.01.1.1 TaxID=2496707 RepID=UPI0013E2EDBF